MNELSLQDRAKLVVAELELGWKPSGSSQDLAEAMVAAVHRNATSPEDSFRLLEAVRQELGLQKAEEVPVGAVWLLAGALGLLAWVLVVAGVWYLLSSTI